MSRSLQERIVKYQRWRLRQPADHPMIGLIWEPDIPPLPQFIERIGAGRELRPDQIEPALFLPHIERWYRQASEISGDTIQRFTPAFGIPWVEAIAGCRIVANPGSLWAEPCLTSLNDRPTVHFDPDNPWLRKLVEFTESLVTYSEGRFPVAVPQMRGPLDTLAAMRTPQQMCIDLLEQPDEVFELLGELTELWIAVGQAVLEVIPPFHGGYMGRMGTWAPGKVITPQNDVSTMVSPRTYAELVLPWDRRIIHSFPYTEFHMHGSEFHQAGNLLTLEKLTVIEFTLEHTLGGAPLETTLPVVGHILSEKPLLLAALDLDTAERCLKELPNEGLCMTIALNDDVIPAKVCQWLQDYCG